MNFSPRFLCYPHVDRTQKPKYRLVYRIGLAKPLWKHGSLYSSPPPSVQQPGPFSSPPSFRPLFSWELFLNGLRFGSFRSGFLQTPTLFRGGYDLCQTFLADLAFRFRRFGRRWLCFAFNLCPPCLLRQGHLSSCGCGKLLALAGGRCWCGGDFCGATEEGFEFGDLLVYSHLLRFVAFNGGDDNLGREFRYWHVIRFTSIPPSDNAILHSIVHRGDSGWL